MTERVVPDPSKVTIMCLVPFKHLMQPDRENVCTLFGEVLPDGSVNIRRIVDVENEHVTGPDLHFRITLRDEPDLIGVLHSHPPGTSILPSRHDRQGIRYWMLGGVFTHNPDTLKWAIHWFGSEFAQTEV